MKSYGSLGAALAGLLALAAPVVAGTQQPSVSITAPTAGTGPITSSDIPVSVAVSGFTIECKDAGMPAKPGRGHVHAMVDGMSMMQMTNLYCTRNFSFSGAALKPGEHTLAVVLASDDHMSVGKPAMVKFDYQPTALQPLPEAKSAGRPTVRILSPQPGTVVGRKVDLKVAVSNFDLSCDLEGKPNVGGYGHLHVFVNQGGHAMPMMMSHDMSSMHNENKGHDMKGHMPSEKSHGGMNAMGGMENMAMPGMVGMPCTRTVPVDLSAWKAGKTKLTVMLANNDHEPTAGAVPAAVDVVVK
jgi:hypothetical protein